MRTLYVSLLTALLIAGCGHYALPGPTSKRVSKADIAGVWEYPASDTGSVTLTLSTDGTFVQSIQRTASSERQIHKGSWDVKDARPVLTVLKPVFGDSSQPWILERADWWIVDSHRDGITFAIFGAADDRDPDSCWEFKKKIQ